MTYYTERKPTPAMLKLLERIKAAGEAGIDARLIRTDTATGLYRRGLVSRCYGDALVYRATGREPR